MCPRLPSFIWYDIYTIVIYGAQYMLDSVKIKHTPLSPYYM